MQENQNINEQNDSTVQIKSIFYHCLAKWHWFLISVAIIMAGTVFYLLKTTPVYTRTAKLLVKSESKGNSAYNMGEFSDLGVFSTSVNINNEIKTMQSLDNMMDIIEGMEA